MAKIKVAVLFGGMSKDYNTSLQSAFSVLSGLNKEKYEIIPIGITKVGRWLFFPGNYDEIRDGTWDTNADCCSAVLSPDPIHRGIIKILDNNSISLQRVDVIFPVIHGKYGECGRTQSLFKLSGIPYVGCDYSASNACSDKMLTHLILDKAGIKMPKYHYLEQFCLEKLDECLPEIEQKLNYPMYVKAASCSPSIGANNVSNREELLSAVKVAFSHHHKVIIEEALEGRTLECIVFEDEYDLKVSEIGEIKAIDEYGGKSNFVKATSSLISAEIDDKTREQIKEYSKQAFMALGCKSFARFDYKLTANGLYCSRVSNIAGLTRENIMPKLMKKSGYEYSELLDLLINQATEYK